MSEPGFREIQLNTKQVVFLFIAGVVAAVAVFLLGVSVGKGVTPEAATNDSASASDPAADVTAGGVMPPAVSPAPGELQYHNELQGKGAATPATTPAPPPAAPPPAPVATPTPEALAPTTTPAARPATAAKPAATPSASGTYLQVDAFGSRANADRRLAQLKAKGFNAFIFTAPTGAARYRVRLGPFADEAAASAMADRLRKEGFPSSRIR